MGLVGVKGLGNWDGITPVLRHGHCPWCPTPWETPSALHCRHDDGDTQGPLTKSRTLTFGIYHDQHKQPPAGRTRRDTRSRESRQEQPINLSPQQPPSSTFPSHLPVITSSQAPPNRSAPPNRHPQAYKTQRREGQTSVNHHSRGHLLTSKVPLPTSYTLACCAALPRHQAASAFTIPACNCMCPCARGGGDEITSTPAHHH